MSSAIQTKSATIIAVLDLNQLYREILIQVSMVGPKRLGYFSCYDNDNNSVFCPDKSALRYLDLPDPVSINCLQGYDQKKKYGHFKSRDTLLLRWVLDNETTMKEFPSDFICSDGVMKDIMTVKYNGLDWYISATKIRGKIVLNKNESIGKKEKIYTKSEKDNKSTYAAFNLQRLLTKNENGKEETSFYGVFQSKIGAHHILYTGKLHCVENKQELDKPFDEMNFVSIEKFIASEESHSSYNAITCWSFATLAGVENIIRAKCDKNFTVENIDKLDVDNLISENKQLMLVASVNIVLHFIKSIVNEKNKCYNFYFNAKEKKLIGYMKMNTDEKIIPSWYIDS